MANEHSQVFYCWWAAANENGKIYKWHWREFFRHPNDKRERENWCGPWGVKSNIANARIRVMQMNEIVVCYQIGEGIVGLARLASEGYPYGGYHTFDLKPKPIVWFDNPIECWELRERPNATENIEYLRIQRTTVSGVTQRGLKIIVAALIEKNSKQGDKARKFIAP